MIIYPKVCEKLQGLESLRQEIEKDNGIELQFFHNNRTWGNFSITNAVERLMEEVPTIKEITIHPPLDIYDLEFLISKDVNIVKNELKECIMLSNKYNIKINMLYHVVWNYEMIKEAVLNRIKELVNMLDGTNVKILIENIHVSISENINRCTVLRICEEINNEHLKICLDTCHLHCLSNMLHKDFNSFLENYIDKTIANKYIYQIHFSATKNNDGYIEKKTHGRKHDSIEELLKEDYKILEKYNLTNKNIVTEVSEENYESREDQKYEIELLRKVEKIK